MTLCTSGFVDDVMFSHYGANKAESKTTLFRRLRHVTVPGAKFAVYDCLVTWLRENANFN